MAIIMARGLHYEYCLQSASLFYYPTFHAQIMNVLYISDHFKSKLQKFLEKGCLNIDVYGEKTSFIFQLRTYGFSMQVTNTQ